MPLSASRGGRGSTTQADESEQRWKEAAAALGPAERQAKFLRLLGAKKGAAAAASTAELSNGDGDGDNSRAVNDKVCVYVLN